MESEARAGGGPQRATEHSRGLQDLHRGRLRSPEPAFLDSHLLPGLSRARATGCGAGGGIAGQNCGDLDCRAETQSRRLCGGAIVHGERPLGDADDAGAATGYGPVYEDDNLRGGTSYYYRVRAVGPRGDLGPPSFAASAIPTNPGAPPAVTGLAADAGQTRVRLTWTPVSFPVAGYFVERSTAAPPGRARPRPQTGFA
jgi:hypothetical protein